MTLSELAKYSMTRIVVRSLRQLSFLFTLHHGKDITVNQFITGWNLSRYFYHIEANQFSIMFYNVYN